MDEYGRGQLRLEGGFGFPGAAVIEGYLAQHHNVLAFVSVALVQ